jgi:hypothetical protein
MTHSILTSEPPVDRYPPTGPHCAARTDRCDSNHLCVRPPSHPGRHWCTCGQYWGVNL